MFTPNDIDKFLEHNLILGKIVKDKVNWDKIYKENEAHWTKSVKPSKFAEYFGERLIEEKKKRVLEVGCANGRDSILFSKLGLNVTSIDIVAEAIDLAIKNSKRAKIDNIQFEVNNIEKTDYKDDYFDGVFTLSVLHSTNIKKSMKEIHRIMKKNGLAFIYLYSNVETKSGDVTSFITVDEYIDLIKSYDFDVEDFFTLEENKYDEANEKHLIIVSEIRKK